MSEFLQPWEHEGSIWKTKAQFFSWVRGQIRRSLWSRYPVKNYIKRLASKIAPKGWRAKRIIQCEFCKEWLAQSKIEVDHVEPAGKLQDWEDIGPFIERMMLMRKGHRLLCKPCHKTHTYAEKHNLSFNKAENQKKVIAIMKLNAAKQTAYMRKHGIWSLESSKNSKTRKETITNYMNNETTT